MAKPLVSDALWSRIHPLLPRWRARPKGGRPPLDERDLRVALSGNICRCTGYQSIVDGLALAVERIAADETHTA